MLTDFDKLYLDSEVQTQKDTVGLAVYHLDIEMGVKPNNNQIKDTINSSRVSIGKKNISSYLSQLKGNLLKKDDEGYKLSAEGLQYYSEKISGAEDSFKYTEKFINVDSAPSRFYEPLITEINKSYTEDLCDSTLILTRKLLENLLIDILRSKFGPQNHLELYYNKDKRQFQSFSTLIENFENKSDQLEHYYSSETSDLIDKIGEFKANGDASAHSIETDLDKDDLEELSSEIDFLSRLLFDIREKV
jgi:hypothetical protein